jgi:glycosyltransferase involved in cell wall biosynthesis
MNILYDYQTFQLQSFGGISRYFTELIKSLKENHTIKVGIKFSDNHHLSDLNTLGVMPVPYPRQEFIKGFDFYGKGLIFNLYKKINPERFFDYYEINHKYSIQLLRNQNYDVFHPTYYDSYFLDYIDKKPFVITIHDMTYEKFPEFFSCTDRTVFLKKELAEKAAQIIAVSENTRKDIVDILGVDAGKVTVIYHGVRQRREDGYAHPNVPDNYLLYTGARNKYKNFFFLVHSIAPILLNNGITLVCTGEQFKPEEIQLFRNLDIHNKVLNYWVNDRELSLLYKNAIALVFPSLQEGFGMPILEAYSNDCPVILSNASCFPEIAGDAGLYFDPKSCSGIRDTICELIKSNSLRNALIEKGRIRMKMFSWEEAAKKTESVYQRCI